MTEQTISVATDEHRLRPLKLARLHKSHATFRRRSSRLGLRHGLRKALSAASWFLFAAVLIISLPIVTYSQAGNSLVSVGATPNNLVAVDGLTEQIPKQYRERYNRWKAVFLSANEGRKLWLQYACNPAFRLTITVSKSQSRGAAVDINDYRWDGGKLVAATIILGHQIDQGYPYQNYYPVLGSFGTTANVDEDVLAAAIIAHEFGHIDQTANSDAAGYQSQNKLLRLYTSHFLSNGRDINDTILTDLAKRLGGTPPEINAQREYWAETYALHYLMDKLTFRRRRELLRSVRKSLASAPSVYYLPSKSEWMELTASN